MRSRKRPLLAVMGFIGGLALGAVVYWGGGMMTAVLAGCTLFSVAEACNPDPVWKGVLAVLTVIATGIPFFAVWAAFRIVKDDDDADILAQLADRSRSPRSVVRS